MNLPEGWSETTVSDHNGQPVRVYRKSAGDLVLSLDARMADENNGDDLSGFLHREWDAYCWLLRRHAA